MEDDLKRAREARRARAAEKRKQLVDLLVVLDVEVDEATRAARRTLGTRRAGRQQ